MVDGLIALYIGHEYVASEVWLERDGDGWYSIHWERQ